VAVAQAGPSWSWLWWWRSRGASADWPCSPALPAGLPTWSLVAIKQHVVVLMGYRSRSKLADAVRTSGAPADGRKPLGLEFWCPNPVCCPRGMGVRPREPSTRQLGAGGHAMARAAGPEPITSTSASSKPSKRALPLSLQSAPGPRSSASCPLPPSPFSSPVGNHNRFPVDFLAEDIDDDLPPSSALQAGGIRTSSAEVSPESTSQRTPWRPGLLGDRFDCTQRSRPAPLESGKQLHPRPNSGHQLIAAAPDLIARIPVRRAVAAELWFTGNPLPRPLAAGHQHPGLRWTANLLAVAFLFRPHRTPCRRSDCWRTDPPARRHTSMLTKLAPGTQAMGRHTPGRAAHWAQSASIRRNGSSCP